MITCVGEALIVLTAERGPLEDAQTFTKGPAGAELNVATTVAALGVPTAVVTRMGDDGFGRYLTAHLADCGVDTSAIGIDTNRPTGMYVKERGAGSDHPHDLPAAASRMLYYRRDSAGAALSIEDFDTPAAVELLGRTRLLHVTGITPALSDSAREAVIALMSGPVRCCFDLNYRPRLWADPEVAAQTLAACVRASDIVLMGLDEATEVFGAATPEQIREMFPEPEYLIIKNDAHQVTGFHRSARVDVPALTVDVVEKIGAGDAFASGFLVGISRGEPIDRALRLGHICAANTLSSTSDATAPDPATVEQLLNLPDAQWRATRFTPSTD